MIDQLDQLVGEFERGELAKAEIPKLARALSVYYPDADVQAEVDALRRRFDAARAAHKQAKAGRAPLQPTPAAECNICEDTWPTEDEMAQSLADELARPAPEPIVVFEEGREVTREAPRPVKRRFWRPLAPTRRGPRLWTRAGAASRRRGAGRPPGRRRESRPGCRSRSARRSGSTRSGNDPPGDTGEGERELGQLRAVARQQANTVDWQAEHIENLGEALDEAIEALAELRAELDRRDGR